MRDNDQPSPHSGILTALLGNPDALEWPQRLDLINELREGLAAQSVALDTLALVDLLADDPKPEVRQAVANLLPLLSQEAYSRLRPKLQQDGNAFVRQSVERATEKRAGAERAGARVQLGVDSVQEELKAIGKRFGEPASRQAWRLCERYSELLIGSMIHDLRSILTHLKANAAAIQPNDPVMVGNASVLRRLREDIEQIERTVADMEQFAEPLEIQVQPENLLALVHAAHDIAVSSIRSSNEVGADTIIARFEIPEHLSVSAARHHAIAAVSNVIKNAYESFAGPLARKDARQISISARSNEAQIELRITDNGVGIASEEAGTFFPMTPGRRNKTKRNSTGYGLPNAMRKIKAQGGSISFESKEGCGTTVTIRLPPAKQGGDA